MLSTFFFCFFGSALILASLAVVLARNPLYNALSLVTAIFSLASLFIILEAFFVGIILLLIYAGAVLVFFLFVIMCLNISPQALSATKQNRFQWLSGLGGLMFLISISYAVQSTAAVQTVTPSSIRGTIEVIGKTLFTDYLLPFELTSFLLLIAIFGIVSLTKGALTLQEEIQS